MPGLIHSFLSQDHARLDALLIRATSHPEVVDAASYADFRAGLLRHIAIEEKVLFPAVPSLARARWPAAHGSTRP